MGIEAVDAMADHADELARSEPSSARAVGAARDAVTAAQALAADGVPGGRLRLARSLWRLTAANSGNPQTAQEYALRWWVVCRSLLERPDPAEDQNRVVARIAYWLGVVIPVLMTTHRTAEAAEVMERVADAADRATGPHGEHASARLEVFLFTASADDFARAVIAGRRAEVAGDLDQMIHRATRTVAVFERHAADGVFEASELAQVLRIISRLVTVAGDLRLAAHLLDRAEAVSAALAHHGPAFRAHADGIRRERDGLTSHVPRPRH
ncbi:hypothetical protein [Micromonospora sp. NPDC049891]|uniref:hypothetical protein n=1 Tax=Micromonospora sp. NPDC049891 TaxID=3155655 RepID=UPI0033F38ED6